MEFRINTKTKEIEIEQSINIRDLLAQLELMFPNTWEEYKIKSVTSYNWQPPYYYLGHDPVMTTTDGSGEFLVDNKAY